MGLSRKHQLQGSLAYHLYNRSHCRVPIYEEKDDFIYFIGLLKRFQSKFEAKIYHWAIMTNHYHLLVELDDPYEISGFVSSLQRAYTAYYHAKYQTVGYLWQGRFKSQAIDKNDYLLACGRYIERNPVKGQLVQEAWDYKYSSAGFYCLGKEDNLTVASPAYEEFGQNSQEKMTAYKDYLKEHNEVEEASFDQIERPVGYEMFLRKLRKERGHYFPRRRGRPMGIFLF